MIRFIALALCVFLAGCSSKPGDREVERLVRDALLSNGGSEIYSLENFQRTNGYPGDSGTYVVEVTYDVVFKKSLRDLKQAMGKDSQADLFRSAAAQVQTMILAVQYGDFPAGHRVSRSEKVTLMKTEKGWRLKTE